MPVELHLATSMEELNKMASSNALMSAYKSAAPHTLYRITKNMYQEVLRHTEDNERAYVFAYRCLKLLEIVYKKDTDKHFVTLQFDGMRKEVVDIFTKLQTSLPKRYKLLAAEKEKLKIVPKPLVVAEAAQPVDLFDKSDDFFILPRHMYKALQTGALDIMIIDIRPSTLYNSSKLTGNYNIINIDSNLIKRGMSASILEESLSGSVKEIFKKRDQFAYVLLMDNDTMKQSFNTSKLKILYDMLTIWDLNKNYERLPFILNGGYVDFVEMYPTLSTNPHISCTQRYADLDDLLNLESIEYPVLGERIEGSISQPDDQSKPKEGIEKMYKNLVWHSEKTRKIEEQMLHADKQLLRMMALQEQPDFNVKDREKVEYEKAAIELERSLSNVKKNDLQREFLFALNTLGLSQSEYLTRPELLNAEKGIVDMTRQRRKIMEEMQNLELEMEHRMQKSLQQVQTEISEREETVIPKQAICGDSGEKVPSLYTGAKAETSKQIPPKINRANKPLKPISLDNGLNGLVNIRNTCYMNSVIQCLRHIPYLRYFFVSGEYKSYISVLKPKLIHLFGDLIQNLWIGSKRVIRPQEFYNKLVDLNPMFGKGLHEDANEFFMVIFNNLNDDIEEKSEIERCYPQQMATFYRLIQKKSVLIDQFYYQIRNDSTCNYCKQQTYSYDVESMIILNPPLTGFAMLTDMIDDALYTSEKKELYCRICERMSGVVRTISYQPRIITILLKRYYADGDGKIRKMTTPCGFPLNKLAIGYAKYKLWGMCLHTGSVDAGHYTAVCLNVLDNRWYEFNDTIVRPVELNMNILEQQIYMLFYQIMDEKAIGFL